MVGTIFTNNVASSYFGGAGFDRSEFVRIVSCQFRNNSATRLMGGLAFQGVKSINVTDCLFYGNEAGISGGLGVSVSESIDLIGNTFISNKVFDGEGGGVSISLTKNVSLISCSFEQNEAERGAGVYISGVSRMIVEQCDFFKNVAFESGSAVFARAAKLSIASSHFTENFAEFGTVMWKTGFPVFRSDSESGEMPPIENLETENTFQDNVAVYGDKYATEGTQLIVESNTSIHVTDYGSPVPPIIISLRDFYNQTVLTDSYNYVEASISDESQVSCHGDDGYLTGRYNVKLNAGVALFDFLEVACYPDHEVRVNFGSEYWVDATSVKYSFRPCERGEYFSDRECRMCPNGTYSFILPETSQLYMLDASTCNACPHEAYSCYGDVVNLKKRYWRLNGKFVHSCIML